MNEPLLVRPRLAFESEFGQHRNWWVRDPRICGNPLSIYLFLLSHEEGRKFSQLETRTLLGLGERAWVSAKKALLKAGFLVEIRDRYPDDYIDSAGNARGRQRRFRLFLQDPEPATFRSLEEAVIELDQPYEEWLTQQNTLVSAKRRDEDAPVSAFCRDGKKLQVSPSLQNADTDSPSLRNADTFIGRENQGWLVGSTTSLNQPTDHAASAREAEVDEALAALHPELRMTYEQLAREVNSRVDLSTVDVVRAVEETVIRAAARGERIANPAAYAAAVIVRNPAPWSLGAEQPAPFAPRERTAQSSEWAQDAPCVRGSHWWGAERLPELDRAHCAHCGTARRDVDPAYAELEAELLAVGSDR